MEPVMDRNNLLKAISDALWHNTYTTIPADVLEEAKLQAVAGLLVGEDLYTATRFVQYCYMEDELVELLSSHNIPMVIVKGISAAIYYPIPSARTFGDIDFIVQPEFFATATTLLEANGYKKDSKPEDEDRHIGYSKHGYHFELHHRFSYTDLDIERYIQDGIENRVQVRIDDHEFPMLPPLANGLVLLAHMREHLKSGLGLRQVIDWMMYVDKVIDDGFWYSIFKPVADELGLTTLAITATALCQNYLGLPARAWCQGADEELVDQLLEAVMTSGNFGIKTGTGNNVETVTAAMKSRGVFCYLQLAGEHNWMLYHRHHFLKPFCWLYQIFRYIRQGIGRGLKLKDDIGRGSERADLLKKLGV